jgi:hypothetical protein
MSGIVRAALPKGDPSGFAARGAAEASEAQPQRLLKGATK